MKDTGNGKDDKKQIGGCYGWDGSEGGAGQSYYNGIWGNLEGDRYVPYLYYRVWFHGKIICQHLTNYTLSLCAVYCMSIIAQ